MVGESYGQPDPALISNFREINFLPASAKHIAPSLKPSGQMFAIASRLCSPAQSTLRWWRHKQLSALGSRSNAELNGLQMASLRLPRVTALPRHSPAFALDSFDPGNMSLFPKIREEQKCPALGGALSGLQLATFQLSWPWQCLYFLPLPHGHGSLRPIFGSSRCICTTPCWAACTCAASSSAL